MIKTFAGQDLDSTEARHKAGLEFVSWYTQQEASVKNKVQVSGSTVATLQTSTGPYLWTFVLTVFVP